MAIPTGAAPAVSTLTGWRVCWFLFGIKEFMCLMAAAPELHRALLLFKQALSFVS